MSLANQSLNLWLEDLHGDQVGLRLRLRECLFSATSPFQRIAVYDSQAFGRVLTLGGQIAVTDLDEATYSECLVHPALQAAPAAERVLILGGGDGGVAREVARYAGVKEITVVEIDAQVVAACKQWFPSVARGLADPRVEVVIDDAHRWLRGNARTYDVVIVDACELENPASDAFHVTSFAHAVFQVLKPGGILVAPLGSPDFDADACRATRRRLAERFAKPQIYAFHLPSLPGGQLAVAWCSEKLKPQIEKPATDAWFGQLKAWHPALQNALFCLPRSVQQQLGI